MTDKPSVAKKNFAQHLDDAPKRRNLESSVPVHERMSYFSAYFYNKSTDLHASCLVLMHARTGKNSSNQAECFGLGAGFNIPVALNGPSKFLAGLSIELLLKAILKILGLDVPNTHRLNELVQHAGIDVSIDQKIILDVLTEYVYWAGRYPTPSEPRFLDKSLDKLSRQMKVVHDMGTMKFYGPDESKSFNVNNYCDIWNLIHHHYDEARRKIIEC